MSAALPPFLPPGAVLVPLSHVESELNRQKKAQQGTDDRPVQSAHMSNLVIFCDRREQAESLTAEVADIVAGHRARVLLVLGESGTESESVTAAVRARPLPTGGPQLFTEEIVLHAAGGAVSRLPFAVRALVIGDLPINVWWASSQPPPMAGPILYELAEHAQQIIYDSLGWLEPARAVAATAGWLQQFEQNLRGGRWRVASDLNWRRLKYWRRMLAQAIAGAAAPGTALHATELLVEHGPHAVIQAWELVSWLTQRLEWKVQAGKVREGVEIGWQFRAAHGTVRVRIRRLPSGPAEVLSVRLECLLGGAPGAMTIRAVDGRRLESVPEGIDAAPRTISVQPQPLSELVGRQLSDRERDPVFTASMGVAQMLAQSLMS